MLPHSRIKLKQATLVAGNQPDSYRRSETMVSRDKTVVSDTDEESSDGNEFKGAGLLAAWLHDSRSKLNTTSTAFIQRTGSFLWAFGENENRALSVQ